MSGLAVYEATSLVVWAVCLVFYSSVLVWCIWTGVRSWRIGRRLEEDPITAGGIYNVRKGYDIYPKLTNDELDELLGEMESEDPLDQKPTYDSELPDLTDEQLDTLLREEAEEPPYPESKSLRFTKAKFVYNIAKED